MVTQTKKVATQEKAVREKMTVIKECGKCVYKYSCGYGSPLVGKETHECIEPQLFKAKRVRVWSLKNQKMETEAIVRTEG